MAAPVKQFWNAHRGLVWSNPEAGDAAHIRAALLRPRFGRLLDISVEFGLARVRGEWEALQADRSGEIERSRAPVERILANIEKGFFVAAACD